jgi:hypothetical protein
VRTRTDRRYPADISKSAACRQPTKVFSTSLSILEHISVAPPAPPFIAARPQNHFEPF